jgi:hypothetical protein
VVGNGPEFVEGSSEREWGREGQKCHSVVEVPGRRGREAPSEISGGGVGGVGWGSYASGCLGMGGAGSSDSNSSYSHQWSHDCYSECALRGGGW